VILGTSRLFAGLLRPLRVDVVCDVGSLNGADALRFRRELPAAEILAFEANPHNFRAMRASEALRRANITVLPCAAAGREGQAEFYVVPVTGPESLARRGMSSLYQRDEVDKRGVPVTVTTRRLDRVLGERALGERTVALWIDAEGAAFEVLQGARGIIDRVRLVHVEVETTPCIGARQKLYPEVARLLAEHGFEELARDAPRTHRQFNALFVRRDLPPGMRATVRRHAHRQWLRHRLIRAVLAACPAPIRRRILRRRQIPAAVSADA
jgi:FkbM family methyltransferase